MRRARAPSVLVVDDFVPRVVRHVRTGRAGRRDPALGLRDLPAATAEAAAAEADVHAAGDARQLLRGQLASGAQVLDARTQGLGDLTLLHSNPPHDGLEPREARELVSFGGTVHFAARSFRQAGIAEGVPSRSLVRTTIPPQRNGRR